MLDRELDHLWEIVVAYIDGVVTLDRAVEDSHLSESEFLALVENMQSHYGDYGQ